MSWDVLEDVIPYLQREEIIFVTGGFGNSGAHMRTRRPALNSIEVYNTLTHQVELSKDTLRTGRFDHSSVIFDGVLYIMGGVTALNEYSWEGIGYPIRDVEAYRHCVSALAIMRSKHERRSLCP